MESQQQLEELSNGVTQLQESKELNETNTLQKCLQLLETELADKKHLCISLTKEIAELKATHAKEITSLHHTIDEQREKIHSTTTELLKSQLLLQQAEKDSEKLKEDFERTKEECNKLQRKYERAKSKYASKSNEEINNLKDQVVVIQKQLEEKDKKPEKENVAKIGIDQDSNLHLNDALEVTESDLLEMKKQYKPLKTRIEKLKMLERICDTKETAYQKLARAIGFEPTVTVSIFREMTNFGAQSEHRSHDFVTLLYHQIIYWNVFELQNLPVMQAIIRSYSDLITKYAQDLDVLPYVFCSVSLLLHVLYKNRNLDLEDIINVEPLDIKDAATRENSSKFTLHPVQSTGDFFMQLKAIVGTCFGELLSYVATHLDLLLDQTILVENFATRQNQVPSLSPLISFLRKTLSAFQKNLVHLSIAQQFFTEVFSRINNALMNGVLLTQQFCTETFGSHLKNQIETLQTVAAEMGQMWVGDARACFAGIKEVAAVLVLPNKSSLTEDKVRKATCPSLNSLQVRQLLSLFTPGPNSPRVPVSVINAIGARFPHTDADRILVDANVVRPFPIKILHYFDVEDMTIIAPSPTVRTFVEDITSKNILGS